MRRVGGYELLKQLGEGGTGSVFQARKKGDERLVALKILSPELAREEEYIKRFRNEAKAAASISHPSVVQVLSAGFDEEIQVPYIVYELVDGVTLTSLVEQRGPLPEREALAVTRAIGGALGELQAKGLVHRDVKPDNILISRSGVPKLADLGLAKQERDWDTITATGIVMGTPDYMAPEQAMGKKDLDLATDLYAVGLTLYVMLTARLPYRGTTLVEILTQHIQKDCPDPRDISPSVSKETARLVAFLAKRDRKLRYSSAAALTRDIDLILAGKPILGPRVEAAPSGRRSKTRDDGGARRATTRAGSSRRRPTRKGSGRLNAERAAAARRAPSDDMEVDALATSREVRRAVAQRSHGTAYLTWFLIGSLLALIIVGGPRFLAMAAPAGVGERR